MIGTQKPNFGVPENLNIHKETSYFTVYKTFWTPHNSQLNPRAFIMKESDRPKKYICEVEGCSKAYSRPGLLEQHKRTHINVRPFKCKVCDKGFFRESHLRVHNWVHSPEKPLKCEICERRFITNQQLSRHSKTHKNPPQYKCPYECPEKFLCEKDLSDHMLTDHIMGDLIDAEAHQQEVQESIKAPSTVNSGGSLEDNSPILYTQGDNYTAEPAGQPKSIEPALIHDPGYWWNWDNYSCKEPSCSTCHPYDSLPSLLYHYDQMHQFVPETLLDALENVAHQEVNNGEPKLS